MAGTWSVAILLDHDKPDVGTAVATFAEDGVEPFVYAQRYGDKTDAASFVAAAKKALTARADRDSRAAVLAEKLATALNGA